jgi:hypothetical protein
MIDEPLAIKRSVAKDFIKVTTSDPSHAEESLHRAFRDSIINRTGNTLKFFADRKGEGTQCVKNILQKNKIPYDQVIREHPSLEDCFTEILGIRGRNQ